MKLRRLLRGLLPPEFRALAEKIESLDPTDPDTRSYLVLTISAFFRSDITEGLYWHERMILRSEARVHFRALAKLDAMSLVIRVPSEDRNSRMLTGRYLTAFAEKEGLLVKPSQAATMIYRKPVPDCEPRA